MYIRTGYLVDWGVWGDGLDGKDWSGGICYSGKEVEVCGWVSLWLWGLFLVKTRWCARCRCVFGMTGAVDIHIYIDCNLLCLPEGVDGGLSVPSLGRRCG